MQPGYNGFDLVLRVVPRLVHIPAQTVIEGQTGFDAERILRIGATVVRPGIQNLKTALGVPARSAEKVIGDVVSGFRSVEIEAAIGRAHVALVDLVVAELTAKLHRVAAVDFRKSFGEVPGVVRLECRQGRASDAEIDERERRQSFVSWRAGRDDSQRACARDEAEIRDLAKARCGLVGDDGRAGEADARLVHGRRPENLRVA